MSGKSTCLLLVAFTSSVVTGHDFTCATQEAGSAVIVGTTGYLPAQLIVPAEIDGHKVVGIGERAFRRSGTLQQVWLPDGLESIGNQAFYYCDSLTTVFLPRSVTFVDSSAFMHCARLRQIEVDEANAVYGTIEGGLYEKATKRLVRWPRALGVRELPSVIKIVGSCSMYSCLSLTSLVVPEGVTAVESGAFQKCYNLETLHLPNTLTSFEPGFTVGKDGGTYRLRDIYFEGSPPVTPGIGASYYWTCLVENGSPTIHVHRDKGWADVIDKSGSWCGCPVEFIELTNTYSIRLVLYDDVVEETLSVFCDEVMKLPTLASKGWTCTGRTFRGWACSNGRRYDDGMLVFNLAQPGETVTMTAIWECGGDEK